MGAPATPDGHGPVVAMKKATNLPPVAPIDAVSAQVAHSADQLRLTASGAWTLAQIHQIEAALAVAHPQAIRHLRVDLAAVTALDTAGAYVLSRWIRRITHDGAELELHVANEAQKSLLHRVEVMERRPLARPRSSAFVLMLERIGKATFEFRHAAHDLLGFFGIVVITMFRVLAQPRRLRFISLVAHIERIGLHALPILGLLSFLIGVVLAYQGADQLRAYGAEIFTVNLLGISILRELGVLLTAIMVAGRSGSAFAAEIGTMKVNEEVDAMTTLGLDPIEVLVLPRILAMLVALPLLTLYSSLMALGGGAVMAMAALDIGITQFLNQLSGAIVASTFWTGMIKAPVFAFVIALVGCYEGLQVTGSAESVGHHTTRSVVESIFLVIIADAAFSILFSIMGV